MNNAFGNAAGEAVPYLSYALALRNFAENPAQAMGTMVGTYAGQIVGSYLGPIGSFIGGTVGGMIGGALGNMLGQGDPPPPPEGAAHFSWDANGHIQHTLDYSQSGGGDVASRLATSVQSLLEQAVQIINEKTSGTENDKALNPFLMPRVGFSGGSTWIEVSLPDGNTVRENIHTETIATRLIELLDANGGLAPAWQVQTEQVRWQHAQEQVQELQAQRDALVTITVSHKKDGSITVQSIHPGQEARYAELDAQLNQAQQRLSELPSEFRLGIGKQAAVADAAYAIQGNAVESADFKSQRFGVLVVHVGDNPAVQSHTAALSQVLRDIENDSYFEKTEWIAAKDGAGNAQGLLVLDFDQNGLIETRDILNLGGNMGQDGNPTAEAALATQYAHLQRNNVEWLDVNGDGQLTASDPAFAAIKLWIDVNQDGQMQAGEEQSLAAQHISSINFRTGEITYADGHSDALTATTLKADTDGVKLTEIKVVNPDGTLRTLDAGTVLEHEGYQGKVQITDAGGTRWVSQRTQTYEHQAKRTGDWEGTAEQEAHRHGGGNVAGSPTETTATAVTAFGPVLSKPNVITYSTVSEGSARLVSNSTSTNTTATNSTSRPADVRIVFVPTTQTSATKELQVVTGSMIESSQSLLFGAGANAGLGVLAAVGMGAVQSAQAAEQLPTGERWGERWGTRKCQHHAPCCQQQQHLYIHAWRRQYQHKHIHSHIQASGLGGVPCVAAASAKLNPHHDSTKHGYSQHGAHSRRAAKHHFCLCNGFGECACTGDTDQSPCLCHIYAGGGARGDAR